MSWEVPVIKFALDTVLKGLRSLNKKGWGRKQKKLLSAVIAELLKVDPDITNAEANLLAAEAVGATPSVDLLRARELLDATKKRTKMSAKEPRAKAHFEVVARAQKGARKAARRGAKKR